MQNSPKRQMIFLIGIIIWILFIFIGYYYFHKPVSFEDLVAPAQSGIDFIILILFVGLCGGLGRKLFRFDPLLPVQRAVVHFCIGVGLVSFLWMGIGYLGLFNPLSGIVVLIGGWIILSRQILSWYSEIFIFRELWKNSGNIEKLLVIFSAVLVIYQLFIALSPPVKWDALTYHLQLPRQYLAVGKIIFVPENPYWGHPQLVEMLYTLAMSLHRAETAAVINWSVGVLILLGIFSLTNTQFGRIFPESLQSTSAGWVAVITLLVGHTFRYEMGWSYTDLFSIIFGLAALMIFSVWLEKSQTRWFIWTGVFCGLAMGAKWTSGVLLLGFFIATLIFNIRDQKSWRELLLNLFLPCGGIVLLTVSPWLIKNTFATGNPLYPYFFSTTTIDASRFSSANAIPEMRNIWNYLLFPVTTTFKGIEGAPGFGSDLGPLLLLLALPGIWVFWRERIIQTISLLLIITGFIMAVAGIRFGHLVQTRLYFAVLPGMAMLAGLGWEWLQRQTLVQVRLRRIFGALILLVSILVIWQDSNWQAMIGPGRVLLGKQSRQSYLENTLGFHILAMQELHKLPTNQKILMLWEPRGFYAPLNAYADLWIDIWRTDRRNFHTSHAILENWRNEGFSYLLIYQEGVKLIKPEPGQSSTEDWVIFKDLLNLLPEPKSIGEVYYLYDLSSSQ